MKIRNDHPVARIVPAHHLAVDAGAEIPWPDGTPVPDGFSVVDDGPTKAELLAEARELGIDVSGRASKTVIAKAIADHRQAASHSNNDAPLSEE